MSFEEAINLRNENPDKYISASYQTMGEHCKYMLELQKEVLSSLIMEII